MSAMRFCLLSTFYPPWNFGGDGIMVQALARALAAQGHEVTVVCAPGAYRLLSGERPPPPAPEPGIELVELPGGPLALSGRYLSGRAVGGRRRLRELLGRGYDVIHFHNPSLLGAPELLAMGEGVKLYTAHEQWLLCPSHVLWRRSGRVCESPPCLSCELSHRRPPQPWRRTSLLRRSLAHLSALIAPSRTSAALHRRFAEVVPIEVLPNFAPPVPESGDGLGVRGVDPGAPYFLFAGRLEPIKGVEGLIDAFAGRAEHLVIAGEGALAQPLRRRAGGMANVHFVGRLSQAELDPLYGGALAVVMPTLGHEAMPLVLLEAFERGTPAVVHRFGALEELAEGTGAAIAYEGELELGEALDAISSDPELRARLGERGRAAAHERFSVDAHLRGYLSLIDRLRDGRSAAQEAVPPS